MIRLFFEALMIPAALVAGVIYLRTKGYLRPRDRELEKLRRQVEANRLLDEIIEGKEKERERRRK